MNREPLSADPRQVDSALRAQLNDISAACQLLQRRAQERDREYLALIYRGTLRAMRILEQRELARRHIHTFVETMGRLGYREEEIVPLLRQETDKEGAEHVGSGM